MKRVKPLTKRYRHHKHLCFDSGCVLAGIAQGSVKTEAGVNDRVKMLMQHKNVFIMKLYSVGNAISDAMTVAAIQRGNQAFLGDSIYWSGLKKKADAAGIQMEFVQYPPA